MQGTPRRETPQDSLRGQDGVEPIRLSSPGTQSPNVPNTPLSNPYTDQLVQGLGQWASAGLRQISAKQNNDDYMEGALARQQGEALENLEMEGNPWALEGYQVMDAQTLSSSLLAAQREEIALSAHEMSPEEYADNYRRRLSEATEGLDERTASLVREQMLSQMPTLVADHIAQNARFREGQNYDSLARSIDVISRDPTATDELVAFARGEAGSEGLSESRRSGAVVAGVVTAFTNDNPLAFSALTAAGVLDNLTPDQTNQIRAAQAAFENRRRSEYDRALFDGERELTRSVEQGELSPTQAVEQLALLYADHGINMDMADAGAIYSAAETVEGADRLTNGNLIEAAGIRGDRRAQANVIMSMLTRTESGGDAQAFRTNQDGRSFGGLLQMGQARLDEVAELSGMPRITVDEFTALSESEQRRWNQRHLIDLIERVEREDARTGIIGSQINGVTVTLSGLVAVGHLGGWPGMLRFMRSGGEYNPSDELGTSLTDYLRTHGSGEMQEYMSADERYNRSASILEQARNELELDRWEQLAPALQDWDQQFINGNMPAHPDMSPEDVWRQGRQGLFYENQVQRTRETTSQETAIANQVSQRVSAEAESLRENSARSAVEEERLINLESAEAALFEHRAAFDEVVSNPESTPEQLSQAVGTLRQARADVFDQYGIAREDQDNRQANERMFQSLQSALVANQRHAEDGALIQAAVNQGWLGDLSPDLQARAYREHQQRLMQDVQNDVTSGSLEPEQGDAVLAAETNAFFAQSGTVPPEVRSVMSSAVLGPLVDSDGNPSPQAIDAITQYAEVKSQNPRAALQFLTEEARVIAEAALDQSAGVDQLGEAIRNMGVEMSNSPRRRSTEDFIADENTIARIEAATTAYLQENNVGFWHALAQGDANLSQWWDRSNDQEELLFSEDSVSLVEDRFRQEVRHLHSTNSQVHPRNIMNMAAENVARSTAVVGGDFVSFNRDFDVLGEMFGNRASEFDHDGVVNTAIVEWLRSDAVNAEYGTSAGNTSVGETLPGWMQGTINFGAGLFGGEFEPAMTLAETRQAQSQGVRPFRAFSTGDGKGLVVEVLQRTGDYVPIVVPLDEVGRNYIMTQTGENLPPAGTQPWVGDVFDDISALADQ